MDIEKDTLYINVTTKIDWFTAEAKSHKKLNRALWLSSSLISISVAICANFEFSFYIVTSEFLTAFLSIILPVVTGYTIVRSPERLWVFEVDIRNRLINLKEKMVIVSERDQSFNREPYEDEYFEIMKESNLRWQKIKSSQANA